MESDSNWNVGEVAVYEAASKPARLSEKAAAARRIAQPLGLHHHAASVPYRLVSIYLSMALARIGVRPMTITIFWGLLGMAGVVALACPHYRVQVAGACALQLSYLLDCVDGEVARLTGRLSRIRSFVDRLNHGMIKAALFPALGYAVLQATHQWIYFWLSFSACVFTVNHHAAKFYAQCTGVELPPRYRDVPRRHRQRSSLLSRLVGTFSILQESPGFFGLILLAAAFRRLDLVVIWYGLTSPIWFFFRSLEISRYRGTNQTYD